MKNYQNIGKILEQLGNLAVEAFHILGLFVIGGTIVWSAIHTYQHEIMAKPYATLDDILLLFIYLELGAMVGIFFRTHRLPVIFLLFISMTALTRYLAIDLKDFDNMKILTIVSAILILSLSAVVLRFSESRFTNSDENCSKRQEESDHEKVSIS
ncbi:phosphate-starvation-inducible protein PsiE [Thiothrix fructosivorans]|uniref:Protein PsiE n=1 Tax=Thiothrix fructosivorans TaxID=111770 RepID=A0A8B0SFB0_9GAMM|nr:phosphate-starvation-inducible PsiE family protein [Thiothrix fructosivorans]MBO0614938.1 phosphate-starvation-inducible PsiE family protein [Thiothrix fructosivorans]QTX09744.1 phosphate-starvation-inducible PsiE family protein [Thiothrix fructosivorans]